MQAAPNQDIELDQLDIFSILAITDDNPDRKALQDEVEEAIWEEIMENEVEEKLSEPDLEALENMIANEQLDEEQKRTALFGFLVEKLPDFEQVVQAYTREIKKDLLLARISGLQEFYQADQAKQEQVGQARQQFIQGQYQAAVQTLNAITA